MFGCLYLKKWPDLYWALVLFLFEWELMLAPSPVRIHPSWVLYIVIQLFLACGRLPQLRNEAFRLDVFALAGFG
jgi:uncharacterized membrane protein